MSAYSRKKQRERRMQAPNGHAFQPVATFVVMVDANGNTVSNVQGPFPIIPLHMSLSMKCHELLHMLGQQQVKAAEAAQKKVLLPDGTAQPPGI